MKRLICLLTLFLSVITVFSQDVIVNKNGSEIQVKVLEISPTMIKYKLSSNLDGPLRSIAIKDVFLIKYENGSVEYMNSENNTPISANNNDEYRGSDETESNSSSYDGNYFMLGNGLGVSYGGVGLRAQVRFGGNVGFGMHAGVGYYPFYGNWGDITGVGYEGVHASAGFKFFPFRGIYIDTQFAYYGSGEEYYYWYDEYGYDSYWDNYTAYGPSLMTGIDQVWGKKIGIGFNIGAGVTYMIEPFGEFYFVSDIGLIVRF